MSLEWPGGRHVSREAAVIEAKQVNHIGIAVHSLEAHRDFYERVLGAAYEGTEEVSGQGVRVAFYRIGSGAGAVRLELLEPLGEGSPVAGFLEKRGEGVHHVAYTVEDLDQRLQELRRDGMELIDEVGRDGAHDTRVAFLHPRSTGRVLTELCEPRGRET